MNLHEKVEKYIRDNISNGTYKVGNTIPPEVELAKLLGVSRPTVRQAMATLVNSGLLRRCKGRGTIVLEPKLLHKSTSMISSYREECRENGLEITTNVLRQEIVPISSTPLGQNSFESSVKNLLVLSRIRSSKEYRSGVPLVYTTIYSPADILKNGDKIDFSVKSFYECMRDNNTPVVHTQKWLEVIPHNPEIAAKLQISPYEPIICIYTNGYDSSNRHVEYSESYYPSSISSFKIELWGK